MKRPFEGMTDGEMREHFANQTTDNASYYTLVRAGGGTGSGPYAIHREWVVYGDYGPYGSRSAREIIQSGIESLFDAQRAVAQSAANSEFANVSYIVDARGLPSHSTYGKLGEKWTFPAGE